MPTTGTQARNNHHSLPAHEVVLLLETDLRRGLDDAQVRERLDRFGPNELRPPRQAGLLVRIARQFHHPLIYVLLAAGAVTAALGEYVDSAVIFGVVLVNALIGFIQESKAESALQSLRAMVETEASVIRDGTERRVPSRDLVPGDLVAIEAGDKAPADIRLLRGSELHLDESALTGESVPVAKDEVVLDEDIPVSDRRNMVYSGTLVTAGTGAGVVVATGAETEIGEIHRLVGSAEDLATPLTRKLTSFSKILTVVILVLATATFAAGLLRGQEPVDTFTAAVALAVGAIPEGLPAAVTITLAIGVARMARRQAVVRSLPAVETLGSTTVICADKTGTLTENQMTVRRIWTPHAAVRVTGSGYDPEGDLLTDDGEAAVDGNAALRWSLLAAGGCNDAALTHDTTATDHGWGIVGDPTEAAMLVAAAKAGLTAERIGESHPRVATIPFSSERQYMATLHTSAGDGHVVLVKGAVEKMLTLCADQMDAAGRRTGAAAESPVVLKMRREILARQLDETTKDFDKVADEVKLLGHANADLMARKQEIEQLMKVTDEMGVRLNTSELDIQMPNRVELIEEASVPEGSDRLFRIMLTSLAAGTGLVLGSGAVVAFEYLRDRLSSTDEVTQRIGLRVVGTVPKITRKTNPGHVAECVDGVRAVIMQTGREAPKVILVTSAVEHEGKTTFSSQLAASLARAGKRTLLLDGDLRHPNVHLALGLDLRAGLPELLRGEISNDEAVQPTGVEGLFAVTGGACDYAAITALSRSQTGSILAGFRESFDHVVVDAGPVLAFADVMLLGQASDVAIVTTMRDVSRVPLVMAAVDKLRSVGVRVLGAVVNGVDETAVRRKYTTPLSA